jgi:hypothetical protein
MIGHAEIQPHMYIKTHPTKLKEMILIYIFFVNELIFSTWPRTWAEYRAVSILICTRKFN